MDLGNLKKAIIDWPTHTIQINAQAVEDEISWAEAQAIRYGFKIGNSETHEHRKELLRLLLNELADRTLLGVKDGID